LLFHVLLPDKDRLSYEEINTKTIQLFEKFIAQNGKSNPVEIDKGLVKEYFRYFKSKRFVFF
jgi:ribonuclease P protein component